jgi:hypothetical protein
MLALSESTPTLHSQLRCYTVVPSALHNCVATTTQLGSLGYTTVYRRLWVGGRSAEWWGGREEIALFNVYLYFYGLLPLFSVFFKVFIFAFLLHHSTTYSIFLSSRRKKKESNKSRKD